MKYLLVFFLFLTVSLFAQNNCLEFDGSDDYVLTPDLYNSFNGTSRTIEMWVYAEGAGVVLSEQGTTTLDYGWFDSQLEILDTGEVKVAVWNSSTGLHQNSLGSVDFNSWNHIVLRYDNSAGQLDGFLNGIESSTNTSVSLSMPSTENLYYAIAGYTATNMGSDTWFQGKIDDIRFWNDIRTEDEIRQNMYRELTNPTDASLAAYYKLNSSLSDGSSNNNNGTYNGGGSATYNTSPAMFGPKNSLDFDGSDDYVGCGTINLSSTPLTLECWVNVDVFQSVSPYISSMMGTESGGTALLRFGDGGLAMNKVQFVLDIGGQTKLDGVTELATNTWYQIAGVYDGSEMKIYINGKLEASKSQTGDITSNGAFNIASNSGSERFLDGSMDEVRAWNTARTASQIRENMCKNLTGNESGLLAYYSFDNTSGTTLQDFSGNEYDGTLNNMDNSDWVSSSAFNTWLNTSSTAWATATNWSLNAAPPTSTPYDNIGVYSYSGGSNLNISGDARVNHFVLGSTSSLTLQDDGNYFYVVGNAILENDIDLNGKSVLLANTAYLIEENGKFFGSSGYIKVENVSLNNITSLNVAGLGAEITTADNMGSTDITRTHGANSSPASIERRYNIEPQFNGELNATLVFHYDDSELNSLTESYLELSRSINGGSSWDDMYGSVNTFVNTITLTGITTFSLWTAMESDESTPPILDTNDPSHNYTAGNSAIIIAPTATVTTDNDIENATISVSPIDSDDVLSVSNLPSGLSSSWDNTTKILRISGTGTATDYQTALRNVKFFSTTTTSDTRTIDFILGDGVGLMIDDQQHFYEVIDNVTSISWSNARDAALASRFGAAQGYLATITSEAENDYLAEKVVADTWIGASDAEVEGVWRWIDGPETGTQFWEGDRNAGTSSTTNYGSVISGEYANWNTNEPNNNYTTVGEDCAHMYGSGSGGNAGFWNDYWDEYTNVEYYIIEYGGDGSSFTTIDDATINVTGAPLPVTLSFFTAVFVNNSATLQWETQSENNNLGWNIYRSLTEELAEASLLNYELIPGAGTTTETTDYSYEDESDFLPVTTYWYWLESVALDGETEQYDPVSLTTPEDIEDPQTPDIPTKFGLYQNYPNPFNPDTQISFALKEASESKLKIYSIKGQLVRKLFVGNVEENRIYNFIWDGKDEAGKDVDSGMYFYQIKAGKYTETKKMLLLR